MADGSISGGIGYLMLFGLAIESPTYVDVPSSPGSPGAFAIMMRPDCRCDRIRADDRLHGRWNGALLARLTPAAAVGPPASTLLLMFWLMAWG